ncbi:MAG: hypothetical protein ACP5E5_14140 [Acidobacteriaceae bacterium]
MQKPIQRTVSRLPSAQLLHAALAALSLAALSLFSPISSAQTSSPLALDLVRSAVAAEVQASHTDHSIWSYWDHDVTPSQDALYFTIETPQGTLRRMIRLNGRPLTPKQQQAETNRIADFVNSPSEQAKAQKNSAHDDAQAAQLLAMLPNAFLWTIVSQSPQQITLSFQPNPQFDPPSMEMRVMSAMAGQMIVVRHGHRIRSLCGRLTHNILIGYGLLAKLYAGGTFDVERRQVGEGRWQITQTHVHIGGHALLFKTIGQQEDEVKTGWKPSTAQTLEQAARALDTPPAYP